MSDHFRYDVQLTMKILTCVCRRSGNNKAAILCESLVQTLAFTLAGAVAEALVHTLEDAKAKTLQDTQDDV